APATQSFNRHASRYPFIRPLAYFMHRNDHRVANFPNSIMGLDDRFRSQLHEWINDFFTCQSQSITANDTLFAEVPVSHHDFSILLAPQNKFTIRTKPQRLFVVIDGSLYLFHING